ncbi:MAG: STAS/SEC14 domain-containing protein [Smithella sp.]|jgi:hypothetical protein
MEKKEKYQVSSSMNEGFLEIVVKGEVTANTYEDVVNEVNAIIKTNNATRVLADFRAIDKRIEPSEMYRYIRNYNAILFDIQYAIVDLPQNVEYKNAAINAGLKSLMWFTDMDAARKWIKGIK